MKFVPDIELDEIFLRAEDGDSRGVQLLGFIFGDIRNANWKCTALALLLAR